jgi:hypothetical protein
MGVWGRELGNPLGPISHALSLRIGGIQIFGLCVLRLLSEGILTVHMYKAVKGMEVDHGIQTSIQQAGSCDQYQFPSAQRAKSVP